MSRPVYSIAMTVYNRPITTLCNTLNALAKADLRDCEIVVIDDGSTMDYEPFIDGYKQGGLDIRMVRVDTVADRPGTYNLEGYNNPSYAWNKALENSQGKVFVGMSSDITIQPAVLTALKRVECSRLAWHLRIIDLDSGQEYLGPSKLFPYGWFFAVDREVMNRVGWDENYLKGIAFEDNDVMARLALEVKRFVVECGVLGYHQSHPSQAYSDGLRGHAINKAYTLEKWGGIIPWDPTTPNQQPWQMARTDVNSQIVMDFTPAEAKVVLS